MKVRPDGKGIVVDTAKVRQQELRKLEDQARLKLNSLREREAAGPIKQNDPTYRPKEAARWAVGALRECSKKDQAPTPALVELVAHLLGVDPFKWDFRREIDFDTSARIVARNPNASDQDIARLIGRNKKTIRNWRAQREFQSRVESHKVQSEMIDALWPPNK